MSTSVHTSEIRVRLKEVAYDHVYFGTVFTWFEVGRGDLSRAAGAPYAELEERNLGSFVVSAAAHYRRPIPPTGIVRLETRLARMTRSRFVFAYSLYAANHSDPAVVGSTEHVMADLAGRPCRIPAEFSGAFTPTGEPVEPVRLAGPERANWRHRLRVRYEETDAFRVVYNGNYFAWMEAAWSGRLAGGPWDIALNMQRGRAFGVLRTACRYIAPARYDDEVEIEVGAAPVGWTRVQLDYRFASGKTGETLAFGRTLHAVTEGGRVVAVPRDLLECLGLTPPESTRSTPTRRGELTPRGEPVG